jgi:outer membrane receptor protein involved in Fe transport
VESLTLRDAATRRPSDRLTLEVGLDSIFRSVDYSIYAPPLPSVGTIGGGFVGQVEGTVGESANIAWLSPAAYVEAEWRALPRLRLVAGLRGDADSRLGGGKTWIDPRAAAFYDLAPGTQLTAAAGLFGSAPQPQETTRTFGNPDLGPQHALHLALGARQALPYAAQLEASVFYKKMWDLVVPTRATDPATGDLLRLSNAGHGEVIGLELLLRRELARGLFGWVSYTLSRSIRQDDPTDPTYPAWRPFIFDQTHILALVLSYRLPGEWILGTRVRAVTGNPYTPMVGNVYDADSGRFQCIPSSSTYSGRLPGFFQADARVDKRWVFDRWMFNLYVDVQNVTNHTNAEARFPGYDCASTLAVPSIPIFPALGFRAEW